jgi:putative transposase
VQVLLTDAHVCYSLRHGIHTTQPKDRLPLPIKTGLARLNYWVSGIIVKKSLSTRTHVCNCGCELHRDTNAAINILNLGKQARGGHPQSNANGLETSTLLGETLVEQVSRLKLESSVSSDLRVSTSSLN